MSEPLPPPSPPSIPLEVVRALADHREATAHSLLDELPVTRDRGPDSVSDLLSAAQAHLAAALVPRETSDVDLDKYL